MAKTTIRHAEAHQKYHPRYVVWELTLKCDLACRHCGSRAGTPRRGELGLAEALGVVEQLARLNTFEITFIGGEAYLYPDWLDVVAAAHRAGIRCTMTTGGRRLPLDTLQAASDAGMAAISVSVDGLAPTHDRLRAVPGSHRAALQTIEDIQAAGMVATANTQINRLNLGELEALSEQLLATGIKGWQVQLTGPMGRAADQPDWLLQPYEMLDLVPRLARIAEDAAERGVAVLAANNLGYFGPYESTLRAAPWSGCAAGRYVLGIEADGSVK
ncbi:MAG: MoaA/NifB/PqqE/SkfB family radical SAM enzyme, partial [Myxococcota bacterium]